MTSPVPPNKRCINGHLSGPITCLCTSHVRTLLFSKKWKRGPDFGNKRFVPRSQVSSAPFNVDTKMLDKLPGWDLEHPYNIMSWVKHYRIPSFIFRWWGHCMDLLSRVIDTLQSRWYCNALIWSIVSHQIGWTGTNQSSSLEPAPSTSA